MKRTSLFLFAFTSAILSLVGCGSTVDATDTCPAEEPAFNSLEPEDNACGADRVCTYTTDPDCPRIRTCSMGSWSFEDWLAEGVACTKPNKVCIYDAPEDGQGLTIWTYCTASSTIHIEELSGPHRVCPDDVPTEGGPCPETGETCTFGEGCATVTAICDAAAGWKVTPMPCP